MHLLNMLGAWWDPVTDSIYNFFGGIANGIVQLVIQVIRFLIFGVFYKIFSAILTLIDFVENIFKRVAGIDKITLNGVEYGGDGSGGDLVYGFITNESVLSVFWAVIALSLVLLLVFTIVAFIKSEFTLDLKGSAKGPIISRSLKSLVNLIAVPAVSIVAIMGVNFLTRTIYSLFDMTGTSLSQKCFRVGAFTANRARLEPEFAEYLSSGAWVEYGSSPFTGSQEAVANAVDEAFAKEEKSSITFKDIGIWDKFEWGQAEADGGKGHYADWHTLVFRYPPPNSYFSFTSLKMVNYFYDLAEFQYILALGSAIAIGWTLLTVCLVLIKRVFELTMLFLLAPPMTAIAPLDGGQAEKKWRQEFVKRLISVIGTIFAYNMYFILIPLFETIELFPSTDFTDTIGAAWSFATLVPMTDFFNILFQLICVFVGVSIVKSASALISSLLGIEDLVKSGAEAAKKAMATGVAAVGMAASITLGGIKGTAAVLKSIGGLGSGVKNKILTGASRSAAKAQLADEQKAYDSASGKVDAIDEDIKGAQAEYDARTKEVNRLSNLKNANPAALAAAKALQEKSSEKLKALNKDKEAAEEERTRAGRSLDLRKSGMSREQQAEFDKAADEVRAKRAGELKGVDEDSQYYKETKESIEQEAKKAFNEKAEGLQSKLRKSNIRDNLANAINSEFGDDPDNSLIAKGTSKVAELAKGSHNIPVITNATGIKLNVSKIPFAGKIADIANSVSEWANVSDSKNRRRLQDMMTKALGDSAAAEAFRTLTNTNARAKMFESIPEEKERGARIENENAMKGRDKYFAKRDAEKAKEEDLKVIRRMLAYEKGMTDYEDLVKKRQTPGLNKAQIDKIDAEIKKLDLKGGVNSLQNQAESFYKGAKADSDELARLQAFKDKMQVDAAKDTIKEEQKQKAAMSAAASAMGQTIDTKITEQSAEQLAKAIANALFNPNGKGFKIAEGIKLDPASLEGFGNSINPLAESIKGLAEQLQVLINEKKKE